MGEPWGPGRAAPRPPALRGLSPRLSPTAPGAARLTPASRLGYPQLLPSHRAAAPAPAPFTLSGPPALSLGRPESTREDAAQVEEAVCPGKVQLKQTNQGNRCRWGVERGPCAVGVESGAAGENAEEGPQTAQIRAVCSPATPCRRSSRRTEIRARRSVSTRVLEVLFPEKEAERRSQRP